MDLLGEDKFERRAATWSDLWSLTRKRWKIVLAALLATMLATYVGLQMTTERYDSSASLLVKVGRENAEMPATVQNGGLMSAGVKPQEINSEIEILKSQTLMEQVVDQIGVAAFLAKPARPASVLLWPKYYARRTVEWLKKQGNATLIALNLKKKLTDREAAVLSAHDSLQVEAEKSSNVIRIDLRFTNPRLGQRVLEVLVQEYLRQHTAVYQNPAVEDFFSHALEQNQQHLQQLQAQRDEVRKKWDLSSVTEQKALLLKERNDIQSQVHANQSEAAMLDREERAMQRRLAEIPAEIPSSRMRTENPSIQSIRDRITSLQLEHAKLASRYQPDAGPVRKNEEELAELKRELTAQPATVQGRVISEANPLRQNFVGDVEQDEVKVAGIAAKQATLRRTTQFINGKLNSLNAGQDALENIDRQIKAADENYFTYAKHLEDARISEELDRRRIANIGILSAPSTSYKPVYPRKLLVMGLSIPLGFMLGILLVLLMGYLDDTIHNERDLGELELVYLGRIPVSKEYSSI